MILKARQWIALLLGSLAFTWLFFAEYLSPFRRVHIPYDLESYHYPLVDYAFRSLKQGRFPQWDWSIYSGATFVGNLQAALFYPPTWLLFLVNAGREHVSYQSLQTFVLLHVWLGAVLCFYWLRRKGLGGFASLAGAQVFAFSGYVCLQLQHQGLVTAFAWFPLGTLGIDEAVEKKRWQPLWKLALASALCFLTGYPPLWMVFAVTMVAYAAGQCRLRPLIGTVVALPASLLLAMVQILPAWEAARFMETTVNYGAGIQDPKFFLSYLLPNFWNFGMNAPNSTNPGMEYLYLGVPGLIGLLLLRRETLRAALPGFLILAATGFLLINPFQMAWAIIRHSDLMGELLRSWYFLAGPAMAAPLLAALGLNRFLKLPGSPSKVLCVAPLAAMIAWSGWELWRWFHQGFPFAWDSAWLTGVALAIFAAGLYGARGAKNRQQLILFTALLMFAGVDYKVTGTSKRFNAGKGSGPSIHAGEYPYMDSVAFREMVSHPQFRVVLDQTAPFSTVVRHWGVTTPQGFDPLLTLQYRAALGNSAHFRSDREFDIDPADNDALHLLGVRYYVSTQAAPHYAALMSNPKFHLIGSADPYFKVFEYSDAVPPFGGDMEVELVKWVPEQREFLVKSNAGGPFHLSEQLLPGWQVMVDGNQAVDQGWRGAFQSVLVPAGEHRVEFRFSSRGLTVGAWISALSLVGLILLATRERSIKGTS